MPLHKSLASLSNESLRLKVASSGFGMKKSSHPLLNPGVTSKTDGFILPFFLRRVVSVGPKTGAAARKDMPDVDVI